MSVQNLRSRRYASCLCWLALAFSSGCSSSGRFVWYTALPHAEWGTPSAEYVIGIGDSLTVKVYEQEGVSGGVKVRSDGRVTVPLIGDIVAAGKHPTEFARELENQLKRFIVAPRVTVNVDQTQPVSVTVLGEVKGGGTIQLDPPPLLLQALAKSGGLTEFADDERIFVIRQQPVFRRIRFTYDAVINNENGAAGFALRTGDVVVVE